MSNKKKTKVTETAQQDAEQPAYIGDLLLNGTTVLTAPTRDELAEMVNEIPADVRYGSGAVGRDPESGAFTLQIHLIND